MIYPGLFKESEKQPLTVFRDLEKDGMVWVLQSAKALISFLTERERTNKGILDYFNVFMYVLAPWQ